MPQTEREASQVLMLRHYASRRCEQLMKLAAHKSPRFTPLDQRKLLDRLTR